jgi:hypothetical protein
MRLVVDHPAWRVWQHTVFAPWILPTLPPPGPWAVLLVDVGAALTSAEQEQLATDLVLNNCRAVVCAGHACAAWEDAVDWANVMAEVHSGTSRPTVMTTSHPTDRVDDVVSFFRSLTAALRPLLLVIGHDAALEERFVQALSAQRQ